MTVPGRNPIDHLTEFEIDRESPVPPSVQLAAYLRDRIRRGQIAPRRRIPSLAETSQATGLARDTVRKAMRRLKAEGLIEYVPGMGLFVIEREPADS